MAGKGKHKKSGQSSRAQQQQQAAARRAPAAPAASSAPLADPATSGQPAADRPEQHQAPPPGVPAPSSEHQYVDISAIRIQDWLGRTPDLKFRRGGSILLTRATAPSAWDGMLPPGARWNDQAGNVDGVVSVVLDPPGQDAHEDQDLPGQIAARVARRMRELMPQCHIQAVTGSGETYAAAYETMTRARRDGDLLIDWPAAPPELILAKPCDQCRAAAAVRRGVIVNDKDKPVDLCRECDARLDAAGRTAGRPSQAPLPEQRLREALKDAGMEVTDFAATFQDMAAAGVRERDDAATQLALIYADGNKVGAFISQAARIVGGPAKAQIAPLLDKATLGALARAVISRFDGWREPPVQVNLAGGDDLLVSVPAADAWLFAQTLLSSFTELLGEATRGWPPEARKHLPTLGAGMVFHYAKTPFSDVVRLTAGQLRHAKAKTRGGAAVAFLDMTADGSQPPPGREPVTLGYLTAHAARLQQVADLPASHRHTLLGLIRDDRTQDFIDRLTDFGDQPLWELAAGPGADRPQVRAALNASQGTLDDVRRALDIARHWHAAPRAADSREGGTR